MIQTEIFVLKLKCHEASGPLRTARVQSIKLYIAPLKLIKWNPNPFDVKYSDLSSLGHAPENIREMGSVVFV